MPNPLRYSRDELNVAAQRVHRLMQPTPQYHWPLLSRRCDCEVWVKHENHTPVGAFKVRGGLLYLSERADQLQGGVICATRGNHGQSVAHAARRVGVKATIVVPQGNSIEKNAAMRALGAELVTIGHDFQAALEFALERAERTGLHFVPSFHPTLVKGVASYALELFQAVDDLHEIYVPIGLGSGICGVIAARDALGLATRVVGVVSSAAPCYRLSFDAGRAVSTESARTMADGMACRVPVDEAVSMIHAGADRVVAVDDAQVMQAMRHYFADTHNVAEGAGAAPLAALLAEPAERRARKVALVLSGGNIDTELYRQALASPKEQV